jgi:hypothetical protein
VEADGGEGSSNAGRRGEKLSSLGGKADGGGGRITSPTMVCRWWWECDLAVVELCEWWTWPADPSMRVSTRQAIHKALFFLGVKTPL